MGKKNKGKDIRRTLIDEKRDEYSPFSKVELKPKEEKKAAPLNKKPGEIVKGYNPSLSFADILSSYEKTGDPYRMPDKKVSSSSVSFGDILDEWENGGKKDKKKEKRVSREENLSSYKATRSFESILNEYEGIYRNEQKEKTKSDRVKAKARVDEAIRTSTMFLDRGDEEIPGAVSWSVFGGRNENFVRKEEKKDRVKEEEKKEYKRVSKEYSPSSSFSSILEEYEKEKIKKVKEEPKEKVSVEKNSQEILPEEPDFFLRDDEIEVPANVSWSVLGGKNENFVREEKKEEEPEEKVTNRRVTPQYNPSLSFSSILSSYEKEKKKNGYTPSQTSNEKTFNEIIQEKGDGRKKKSVYTINELRRMDVQATLDLHGETQKDSRELISSFLSDSVSNGLRKVSIITGKGLHSENGSSVLRDLTLSILMASSFVQETSQAPLTKGGSGALWIILKDKDK